MYRQCELVSGNVTTIGWIEDKFAKIGLKVTLEDFDLKQIWVIKKVSSFSIQNDEMKQKEISYRKHRKFSDI